jgi:hypothetical protein
MHVWKGLCLCFTDVASLLSGNVVVVVDDDDGDDDDDDDASVPGFVI